MHIKSRHCAIQNYGGIERENQNNKNKKVKAHPILSGIIDFYLASVLVMALICMLSSMTNRNLFAEYPVSLSLGILVIIIVADITYYTAFAKKVGILSLGEYMTGRRIEDGSKKWTNPYGTNRFGIFLIIIINVILLGNEWDRGGSGYIYSFAEITGKLIRIGIIVYALKLTSEGKLNGVIGLTVLSVLSGFAMQLQPNYPQLQLFALYMNLLLAAIYLVVYIIYRNILSKQNQSEVQI